ncbi:hypothetical protein HPB52_006556 [Rhipicephalus sanguineus]|uniref:Uncharacterized protein n=1 Tax=Rhipicephalus sanguineus TaxID=34632 RepID=A0A9D4QHR9_RHISA|nr:hypothetical protein HPB52_006556 [Rhipicephalus sanguineus]
MPASLPPPPPGPRKQRPRRHFPLLIMAHRSFVTETHAIVSLSGYVTHNQVAPNPLPHPVTAVLTRRTLVVNRDDLAFPAFHHIFLEILRQRPYNPPRAPEDPSLLALLCAAATRAAKSVSICTGATTRPWPRNEALAARSRPDPFPAHRPYATSAHKSACRDTTLDLSFCRSVRDARWSLGRDHYVLTIQVRTSLRKSRPHTVRYTIWDAFRERRLHSAAFNI